MPFTALRYRKMIGVIGGSNPPPEYIPIAEEVGREIARNGAILVCGGKGGVMMAAAKGAKEENGLTIGIMPEPHHHSANKYIDLVIPTGLGHIRNTIIAQAAHGLVAIDGAHGTLTELAFGLLARKPIVSIDSWEIKGIDIKQINDPKEALEYLCGRL